MSYGRYGFVGQQGPPTDTADLRTWDNPEMQQVRDSVFSLDNIKKTLFDNKLILGENMRGRLALARTSVQRAIELIYNYTPCLLNPTPQTPDEPIAALYWFPPNRLGQTKKFWSFSEAWDASSETLKFDLEDLPPPSSAMKFCWLSEFVEEVVLLMKKERGWPLEDHPNNKFIDSIGFELIPEVGGGVPKLTLRASPSKALLTREMALLARETLTRETQVDKQPAQSDWNVPLVLGGLAVVSVLAWFLWP